MNQSEQINELAAALSIAQTTMKAPVKDCINPYFKSKYASLESIGKASLSSLKDNGLAIVQGPDYKDGHMVLVTKLLHKSGQWIETYSPLLPVKQDSQGIGASITYMKRYAWPAMIGLTGAEEDDDGNAERKALDKQGKPIDFKEIKLELPKGVETKDLDEYIAYLSEQYTKSPAEIKTSANANLDNFWATFRKWEEDQKVAIDPVIIKGKEEKLVPLEEIPF